MASDSGKKGGSEYKHKQQQSIRDTIHLLSSLLSECGVPRVSSECFRRAKFNKRDAIEDLLKLAFHVMQTVMVLDGDACDGNMDTITYLPITSTNLSTVQTILRHYMFELGYKRKEFYLPFEDVGSREMLLAFAWILHRTCFFSKLSKHFLEMANRSEIPLKHTSKHLVGDTMEENRVMGYELENIMESLLKCADNPSKSIEALHKLVWLKGRLDGKFKSVQGLCSAYHSLADRIHKSTGTNSSISRRQDTGNGHLSTHEVFLLRYPNQMKGYLAKLRQCVNVLHKIIQWQDTEDLFWQWMESILDLQEDQDKKGDDESTEEFNDVRTLTAAVQKQQEEFEEVLARSKHRIDRVDHVWSHNQKILHHKDVNSKSKFFRNQLQFEYPITVLSTNRTACVSSTVEQVKAIDCPVYAPIVQSPLQAFPSPNQLQQASDTKLVQVLGDRLQTILQEVAVLDRVIRGKKSEIRDAVQALEKWLPATVCKVETTADV